MPEAALSDRPWHSRTVLKAGGKRENPQIPALLLTSIDFLEQRRKRPYKPLSRAS
jgi:hypothetical protein